ncbi:Calx-beta domain-containing protein, partial [Crocosphaera sp.]|uniref:Calx-beta domain-containing protein n=1 Tax=Crocosphaera sp. TaxID=2729996 RepID=UPI002625F81F
MTNSLTAILPTVFDSLFDFAQSDEFWDNIAIAFGTEYDVAEAEEIRTQWQNREFSQLPEIEIINDVILGDFRGGYAVNSNDIYLADSFVETTSSQAILTVLLEEIGHFVDAEVNEIDTEGDEGELFSGLVREFDFSEVELTRIKAENDLNYVFFGNNLVALETSDPIILIVDTTVDENDGSADIGAGLSLRDAISIANQSPNTPHIIKLRSGLTYELTYISNQATGFQSLNTAGNITIESDGNEYAAIVHNNDVIPEGIGNYIIRNQRNSILNLNNIAISNQDGAGLYNNGTLKVDNSLISDNAGYGISNWRGTLKVDNSSISDNASSGIDNSDGTLTLTNNTITGNGNISLYDFDGIENSGGTLTLTNNTITNNSGGGIDNSHGTLTLTNNTITNNTSYSHGGGIYNLHGTLTLNNNTITDNTSDIHGGGIYNLDGTLTLNNNTITNNTSMLDGGGIYNSGGGIYNSDGILTLTNNTITNNTSMSDGGGIYNLDGTLTLINNIIIGNTSDYSGGGIYNVYGSTLTLTNNIITGNTSDYSGGGIVNGGIATLENNIITGNTSGTYGGGIFNSGTWSSNSTISGNISNEEWYINPDGELTSLRYGHYPPEYILSEHNLHPTYPDIFDLGDTGTFTPLPPFPETLPQPTISISDTWVEVETNTNQKTLVFEVKLSSEYDKPIIVEYYTLDGSATSSDIDIEKDYNNISQNILTFLPGETKKEIEITVFGSVPVTDATLELFARDTAYREWTDADIGKLVDSVYDYSDLDDFGYKDYYIDKIINNETTDFNAVGLTAYEDLFVVLANPVNAEIAENNNNFLQEIANSSGGTDTQAYLDGQTFINQLNSTEQDYTFAKGTIYDQAKPPILAIRGTESSLDWLSNASPEGVGYSQFEVSKGDINQWLSDVSNPEESLTLAPHITGHSLGGALTQWVGASYPGELGKIVTFGSPGISQKDGINLNPSNNQGVKHYITSADIVSMAGSTYLNGVWDLSKYSKFGSAINVEKHFVPILNPENLRTGAKRPNNLVTKVSDGNTTDLSDFYFTYLPDADYFLLQTLIARLGGPTGKYIAAVLTFRGTAELNREAIGKAIDLVSSTYDTISNRISFAWNAAKLWRSPAWDLIIDQARTFIEDTEEIQGLSSTSDFALQSFDFDTSTQSVNINQSLLEAQTLNENTIATTESEPINNFWNAMPLWIDEAWDATGTWSDEAWKSITEWTPETWEMTTEWTENDWDIPFLTISNPTVTENDPDNQELVFNVSLSTPSNETITVNYATEDGTATAGNDYTSINGTLTFEAGETNKTITVPILDDNVLEEDETLYLNLTQSANAHLTDNQAIATIINQQMSNQSPTDLNLSNSRIREHQPIDRVIGEFITTDPDTGNTFTYTLVSGDGSTDNNSFTIDNNQLKTNTILDYETKNSYDIRVRTTDQDGLFFEKALTINIDNVNEASLPIIKDPISDLTVIENAANTNIDLLNHFDDPLTTGQVARFELYNTDLAGGIINVLLFDQAENGAPLTVDNFINYAEDDDYVNSIIHRSVPGFIIQGGGFTINNLEVSDVPDDPAVQNEFSRDRSNLRGTIAMAKLGNNPNSATNQWFFNLEDNASNLDNQNGGFTVFGEVLSQNDLAVIDEIATVPIFNGVSLDSAFTNLPLQIDPNNAILNDDEDFVIFRNITVSNVDELIFSIVNNSNPSLVDVSINNNQLIVDYKDDQAGTAEITIQAKNLLGHTVEDTLNINVISNEQAPTDLDISNNEVSENLDTNTVIGTLSTTALNEDNSFTYSLISGERSTDNNLFKITNNQLITNAIFDYETKSNYSIRVRTTDQNGLSYEKILEIDILNINEAPTDLNFALDKSSYHPLEMFEITGNILDEDGSEDLVKIDLWLQQPNG